MQWGLIKGFFWGEGVIYSIEGLTCVELRKIKCRISTRNSFSICVVVFVWLREDLAQPLLAQALPTTRIQPLMAFHCGNVGLGPREVLWPCYVWCFWLHSSFKAAWVPTLGWDPWVMKCSWSWWCWPWLAGKYLQLHLVTSTACWKRSWFWSIWFRYSVSSFLIHSKFLK